MYDSTNAPPMPLVQNVDFHVWLPYVKAEEAQEYMASLTSPAVMALVRVVPVPPVLPELGRALYRVTSLNSYDHPTEAAAVSLAVALINAQP